ncbi:MAG: response regulator [Candidatus Omnitrophica bacterium]|nr:response regulator [Candidatus Omnitrophota bacterium]
MEILNRPELLGKKILVIEDEEDTRALLVRHLKQAGYALIEAVDAESGLSLFREWQPDLVILDLILPGMSGLEFLQKVKSGPISCKVPIVVLTAKDEAVDKIKGYRYGADYYLTKPCEMKTLLLTVETVLSEKNKS